MGLWKYCYDDQLYDLVEIVNPMLPGRRKRSTEERQMLEMNAFEPGTFDIRCHDSGWSSNNIMSFVFFQSKDRRSNSVPELPDMWVHLRNKLEGCRVTLIISITACILSFLLSILVLITRAPSLKLLLLLACCAALIFVCVSIGLIVSAAEDHVDYFNETLGRSIAGIIKKDFKMDLKAMSISLKKAKLVKMIPGVSFIFVASAIFVMFVATVFAELIRNLS
ncbi:hypothetical protein ACHWQZ_G018261 [Mnemiopsis leidyi]